MPWGPLRPSSSTSTLSRGNRTWKRLAKAEKGIIFLTLNEVCTALYMYRASRIFKESGKTSGLVRFSYRLPAGTGMYFRENSWRGEYFMWRIDCRCQGKPLTIQRTNSTHWTQHSTSHTPGMPGRHPWSLLPLCLTRCLGLCCCFPCGAFWSNPKNGDASTRTPTAEQQ